MALMLKRHVTLKHKVHCFTDMPEGIKLATTHTLVGDPQGFDSHGKLNCFRRIWLWSPEARKVLGVRAGDLIVSLDLDGIVLGNLDTLLLSMYAHQACFAYGRVCEFNGSLWSFKPGAYPHVWDNWDPMETPKRLLLVKAKRRWVGSDQAYFSEQLIGKAHKIKLSDGILHYILGKPTSNTRLVFFAGSVKPWDSRLLAMAPVLHAQYQRFYQKAVGQSLDSPT